MSCCKRGQTFKTSCAEHFLERLNWFHSGISADRGRGFNVLFRLYCLPNTRQKVESEEKLILSHIRRISCFKIKHILRVAFCTRLAFVRDDVMKASKSIFPKTLPARMKINENLGDGTASDVRRRKKVSTY